jgi:hypothetical protein
MTPSRTREAEEMALDLPEGEVLRRYMYLLTRSIVTCRARLYGVDDPAAALLDAVENIPELVLRWHDAKEDIIREDLTRIEAANPEWKSKFTGVLDGNIPDNWPWKPPPRKMIGAAIIATRNAVF